MRMIMIVIGLLLSGCSHYRHADRKELYWQALHVVDVMQTTQIAKCQESYSEKNALTQKVIGKKPSEKNVYAWGVATAILYHYLNDWMRERMPTSTKQTFQFLFAADATVSVYNNFGEGVTPFRADGCD